MQFEQMPDWSLIGGLAPTPGLYAPGVQQVAGRGPFGPGGRSGTVLSGVSERNLLSLTLHCPLRLDGGAALSVVSGDGCGVRPRVEEVPAVQLPLQLVRGAALLGGSSRGTFERALAGEGGLLGVRFCPQRKGGLDDILLRA